MKTPSSSSEVPDGVVGSGAACVYYWKRRIRQRRQQYYRLAFIIIIFLPILLLIDQHVFGVTTTIIASAATPPASEFEDEKTCSSRGIGNDNGGVCQQQQQGEEIIEDETDGANDDNDVCSPSQTSLAMEMVGLSSPQAIQKLRRILSTHNKYFYVDLGGNQKVFDEVSSNMILTLKGYGLQQLSPEDNNNPTNNDSSVLQVITFFSDHRKATDLENPNKGILFLQTEQICCSQYGQYGLPYLAKCAESPNCIIWEYSQTNLQFLKEKGLENSVMLVPFLHQQRLQSYYPTDVKQISKLGKRPIDVVFFGVMTPRRTQIQQQLQQIVQHNNLQWNLLLEEVGNSGSHLDYMASKYLESKICLIIHGFVGGSSETTTGSPGEYHRLSELAGSGCLPIVESFGDTVGIPAYQKCGGVIFSDLQQIPNIILTILQTINHSMAGGQIEGGESFRIDQRLKWWKQQIQWDQLLTRIVSLVPPPKEEETEGEEGEQSEEGR